MRNSAVAIYVYYVYLGDMNMRTGNKHDFKSYDKHIV